MAANNTALALDTPGIEEVLGMLRSEALFAATPELWHGEEDVQQAINDGKEHRRKVLSAQFEGAAADALDTLRDILADPDVPARDKIKAAEGILDRCGIAPSTKAGASHPTGPVVIDVDFDERLARIVATGHS